MPQSDSDNEHAPDEIPARRAPAAKDKDEDDDEADGANDARDDEDEEEDGEDEYIVEKILSHKVEKSGEVLYRIKWEGYPNKSDQTWEPISNLSNAKARLDEYHAKIGGDPAQNGKAVTKKRGRRAASEVEQSPARSAKKSRTTNGDSNGKSSSEHKLPSGTWDNDVDHVSAIVQEESDGENGKGKKKLIGLLKWKNGTKTQHSMEQIRVKLPQRLIDYFQGHLVFQAADTAT